MEIRKRRIKNGSEHGIGGESVHCGGGVYIDLYLNYYLQIDPSLKKKKKKKIDIDSMLSGGGGGGSQSASGEGVERSVSFLEPEEAQSKQEGG